MGKLIWPFVRAGCAKTLVTIGISQEGGTKRKEVGFSIEIREMSVREKRKESKLEVCSAYIYWK